MTVWAEALFSVTVKLARAVPLAGSVRLTSAMLSVTGESCTVAVPVAWVMLPMLGLASFSAKVSLASARPSALTTTLTVLLVSPAAKVMVPDVAV